MSRSTEGTFCVCFCANHGTISIHRLVNWIYLVLELLGIVHSIPRSFPSVDHATDSYYQKRKYGRGGELSNCH